MENMDIRKLVTLVLEELRRQGYSDTSLHVERKMLNPIAKFHEKRGETQYNPDLLTEYTQGINEKFEHGELERNYYRHLKRSAERLSEFFNTETIQWHMRIEQTQLPTYYETLLNLYKTWNKSVNRNYLLGAKKYFKWLAHEGYPDLTNSNADTIKKYLLLHTEYMTGGSLANVRAFLKKLYQFLYENKYVPSAYEALFSFPISIETKIQPAVPQTEVAVTLENIDKTSFVGKRDYAMVLLGTVMGLRCTDIAKLKLTDIDWQNGKIQIFQSKTGKPLALPLTGDVGEALRDYILNGRQQINTATIFLSEKAPFSGLSNTSIGRIYNRYRIKAGLVKSGFHSLRRAAGRNMITAGVPITTVSQVLGHSKIDSTKPYISLDSKHLKECALSFDGVELENKAGTTIFVSAMACALKDFFEHRTAMGFSKDPYAQILKQFDQFCVQRYPDLEVPNKEAVLSWWTELSSGKFGNSNIKANAIRLFGKYMNAMGKDAYVLPTSFVAKRVSFTAYLFTDEELKSFFNAADSLVFERNADPLVPKIAPVIFRLLYTCGLRPNEGRELRRSNINFETGEILITETKRKKERIVVASDHMLSLCKQYDTQRSIFTRNNDFFFPQQDGNPYSGRQIRDMFKRCWRLANPDIKSDALPKVRPYDLRHRFASAVLQKWLDEKRDLYAMLPYLRSYMGHNDLSDTAYYIHILPENLLKSPGVDWKRLDEIAPEVGIWPE